MKQKDKFKQTEIGMIPKDWEEKQLGKLVTFQRGHDLPRKDMKLGKYPVVGSNGIIGYNDVFKAKGPGVTIGRSGNLGRPFFVKEDYWPHNTVLYVKDFHNSYPKFIYYFLKLLGLSKFNAGSAVPTLNRNHIHTLLIIVPKHIEEQRSIAKILSDIDSKIELTQKMNKALEAIGQALFKRWFIDFEFPNEKGKPYKSSGGEMVDSELGDIPKGWRVETLDNLGAFKNGVNYSREETGDTIFNIINVRDLVANNFVLESSLDKIKMDYKKAEDYLLEKGDIVIARSASPGETYYNLMGEESVYIEY